jgi:hypothetical protein
MEQRMRGERDSSCVWEMHGQHWNQCSFHLVKLGKVEVTGGGRDNDQV